MGGVAYTSKKVSHWCAQIQHEPLLKKENCRNKLREFSNCSYNRLRVLEKIELWNCFWWSCSSWTGDCCQSSVSGKWKHISVRKSTLCGNSNQFCFVFGSFTIRSKTSWKIKTSSFRGWPKWRQNFGPCVMHGTVSMKWVWLNPQEKHCKQKQYVLNFFPAQPTVGRKFSNPRWVEITMIKYHENH